MFAKRKLTIASRLPSFALCLCLIITWSHGSGWMPHSESVEEFSHIICCSRKGKLCACSTNRDLVLDVRIPGYVGRVPCGSIILTDTLQGANFQRVQLNLATVQLHQKYIVLFIDADGSSAANFVRVLWLRGNIFGSELSTSPEKSMDVLDAENVVPYESYNPLPSSDSHRYQFYIFEHSGVAHRRLTLLNMERDKMYFKHVLLHNKLCDKLVASFQILIATSSRDSCYSQMTCTPACGVFTPHVWPQVKCGGTMSYDRILEPPVVSLHAALNNMSYLIVMLFYSMSTYQYGWVISDVKGEQLVTSTNIGDELIPYSSPRFQTNQTYHVHLYILEQLSRQMTRATKDATKRMTSNMMVQYLSEITTCHQLRAMFMVKLAAREQSPKLWLRPQIPDEDNDSGDNYVDYYQYDHIPGNDCSLLHPFCGSDLVMWVVLGLFLFLLYTLYMF